MNCELRIKPSRRKNRRFHALPNAAGDVTSLLGKTLQYDNAGRVSLVTAIPPCPTGLNCSASQTTLSRYNGHNQRYLRENTSGQTIFTYGPDGHSLLSETAHRLIGATTMSTTTETIYLPTASGPMPVVAVIGGETFAVYADHLNTPRRLTDAQGRPRWQWAFSGFGERAAQSIPVAGKPTINYSLRYPGQVDDGNGLFYNFNRFYDPLAGRYTSADPIGLDGGWNRFGYVGGNALGAVDPMGLMGAASELLANRPIRPPNPAGANFTFGFGGSCHALPLGIGLGADSGVVLDTSGNVCVYSNICYTVGPGYSGSLGVVASANSGLASSGTTNYSGATWTGGAGLVGSGSALGGSDGSGSIGRGLIGVGGGAMAGFQSCRVQYSCLKN